MKSLLLLCTAMALLSGCAAPSDPTLISDVAWGNGVMRREARRIDERTFTIEVYGAGFSTQKQVMDAWVGMADKLAAGRKYAMETSVSSYDSYAPGPYGGSEIRATKVSGRITLEPAPNPTGPGAAH